MCGLPIQLTFSIIKTLQLKKCQRRCIYHDDLKLRIPFGYIKLIYIIYSLQILEKYIPQKKRKLTPTYLKHQNNQQKWPETAKGLLLEIIFIYISSEIFILFWVHETGFFPNYFLIDHCGIEDRKAQDFQIEIEWTKQRAY